MIKINVLLENNSIDPQYKTKHGLSLLINFNGDNILLDVGPDNNFAKNAKIKNINLKDVHYLFLSHNHYDHTGGIKKFIKMNNTANIYLMDNIDRKYYKKFLCFYKYIGIKLSKGNKPRITQVTEDLIIDNKIYFIHNISSEYEKPIYNKKLFKKDNNKIVHDTFDHEGILVLEDNNELVIFNSCSHNGILNAIETVKVKIPNKKIRSYVGGLHLFNPPKDNSDEYFNYLDGLIKELKDMDIAIYTGHCTGRLAINYMKEKLKNKIQEINTGMELTV